METFATELTDKRFVSGVDACVCVERGAAVEGFSALVTLVRLFLQKRREERNNRLLHFIINKSHITLLSRT